MLSRRLPQSKEELPLQFAYVTESSVVWVMGAPIFPDPDRPHYQVWINDGLVYVRRLDGFILATTNTDTPDKAVYLMNRLHV